MGAAAENTEKLCIKRSWRKGGEAQRLVRVGAE